MLDNHNELCAADIDAGINDERIIVKDELSKKLIILMYEDIFAFLSFGNYVKVKTEKKFYVSHNSMKRAEALFCSRNRFIRISRTAIVSKNKIESIEINKVTLRNGTRYAIGRNFRKAFFEKLKKKYF